MGIPDDDVEKTDRRLMNEIRGIGSTVTNEKMIFRPPHEQTSAIQSRVPGD